MPPVIMHKILRVGSYLEGAYGCGKTHLAAAVGNYRLEKGDQVLFITMPDLLDHLRASFRAECRLNL